jgi:hypothetical protein
MSTRKGVESSSQSEEHQSRISKLIEEISKDPKRAKSLSERQCDEINWFLEKKRQEDELNARILFITKDVINTELNKRENTRSKEFEVNIPLNLKWIKSKTDLCELIHALSLSKSIQQQDGQHLPQKELVKIFENIFNIELSNFDDLMSKALRKYKRIDDKTYFMNSLADLLDEKVRKTLK